MFRLIKIVLVMLPLVLMGSECVPPAVDSWGLRPIVIGDSNAATRQDWEIDRGFPARWPARLWGDPDGFQNLADGDDWTLTAHWADFFGQPGTAQPGRSFYIQSGSVEAFFNATSWAQTSRDYRRDMDRIVSSVLASGVEVVVIVGSPRYMGDISFPDSYQWFIDQKNERILDLAISDRVICDTYPSAVCIDTFSLFDSREYFEDDGRKLNAAGHDALAIAVPEPGKVMGLLAGVMLLGLIFWFRKIRP